MRVYLVQHGEAKPKEDDPQRPLSEKGWADVRKVAFFIAEQVSVKVNSIEHSGKTRAQQTAEVLAKHLNPDEGCKEVIGLGPLDDPEIWAKRLAETDQDRILVGHLPHLAKLAALLLCQDTEKEIVCFQMGGIVCLGKDESGAWSVNWMLVPQMLS